MSLKTKGFFVKTTEQVHIDFKVACAKKGKKMTDVIEKFMVEYSKK
jgi:hypothetical protein